MAAKLKLVNLLCAVAPSLEVTKDIVRLFSDAGDLHCYVLEPVYRQAMGEQMLRRTKIWQARGYLWWEAETWDQTGAVFERDIIPIGSPKSIANFLVESPLNALQLRYARNLQSDSSTDGISTLHNLRLLVHTAVMDQLSSLAATLPCGCWPVSTEEQMASIYESKKDRTELCFDYSLLQTGTLISGDLQVSTLEFSTSRIILEESLRGHPGGLTFTLSRETTEPLTYTLEEKFFSDTIQQSIIKRCPIRIPEQVQTIYFPYKTLNQLIDEHTQFSHWRYNIERKNADEIAFARTIHSSADFVATRDYLGKLLTRSWSTEVTTAAKWDLIPLIFSAALTPIGNVQISRRLRISRTHNPINRLVYQSGIITALMIKFCWLFGWMDRSQPCSYVYPFPALYPNNGNDHLASN